MHVCRPHQSAQSPQGEKPGLGCEGYHSQHCALKAAFCYYFASIFFDVYRRFS